MDEMIKVKVNEVNAKVRRLAVIVREDGSIDVSCNAFFIAREMRKIHRVIERWFRVSRRNFRVEQNKMRSEQDKEKKES